MEKKIEFCLKPILSLLLCFGISISVHASGKRVIEGLKFKSTILNADIRYTVVLPSGYYDNAATYPVVYLLHGFGDNESSWLEYGRLVQHVDRLVNNGIIAPVICVMPQGFCSYYVNDYLGRFRYQDMFVNELVPLIDTTYRTRLSAGARAVMGYSMGGFGALMLPLAHPRLFSTSLVLSASIRTDEQYKKEEQSGWDKQWGHLFGGEGKSGDERITPYYRENSPFHVIATSSPEELNKIAFFIENGDKEYTLCRSNEELHMLMSGKGVVHTYQVRSGGHEFSFWRQALDDALIYADSCFRSKGQSAVKQISSQSGPICFPPPFKLQIGSNNCTVYLPEDTTTTQRLYPVVYFSGDLSESERSGLMSAYRSDLEKGKYPPMIFCFVPILRNTDQIISDVERLLPARTGRRFRALWGFGEDGQAVFESALLPDRFTACVLTCAHLEKGEKDLKKSLGRCNDSKDHIRFYLETSADGPAYKNMGYLHITMREQDFNHEYRVRKGVCGYPFLQDGFLSALDFISNRFHN